MKNISILFLLFIASWLNMNAQQTVIRISTDETDLILKTAPNNRLYQAYLGEKLLNESDVQLLPHYIAHPASDGSVTPRGWEVYPASGAEDFFEPAFAVQHNDGNMTSILYYKSHEVKNIDGNAKETIIRMADNVYPVEVTIHYMSFAKENVIKSWTEIKHNEKKPVKISQYASAMLYFESPQYYLNEYSGDWAKEAQLSTQELRFGKKTIDTKLGSRAAMHAYPFFQLGLGQEVQENQGKVLAGTIGWTGNFRFTFEVDNVNNLRVISGINPYASTYELKPNEVFKTPEFIYTLSYNGVGKASRNLHQWAMNYQLKDGKGDRLTLLNNWESTAFNFDEKILGELMYEAKELGVEMFLLDDGWFGNKYPRANDQAGLGDWEVMHSKLPNGIPGLVKAAKNAGVKFGLWVEPEMVNPKSELFEKHPEWAIHLPNRELYYYRNQLVLDLSNPQVQDYAFGVVDKILKENPDIAYLKWDCNSPITNIYSPYLKEKQNHLYINHVRGLYNILERVTNKYPHVEMMMCSGGGGRCDYEGLKYFSEFWCSDNTDPVDRLYIQWNFSQFFPIKSMAAHVTSWNKSASIKFRTDVAMMCKLGFDISLKELSDDEREFCKQAVKNYNSLKDVILNGNFYRLVSPYESEHTSVMHVSQNKNKAVVYAYDIFPLFGDKRYPIKLQGLDPTKKYKVEEINLMPGASSRLSENGNIYTGDYLMKIGLDAFTSSRMNSKVIELTAQ
ncbi:alpha-galactosidase [Dysgonomonas sp. 25]|uniref:alpha-galactosidase n=1 Tax=Dysgonomonas sp. 25 TaxID=2302933 RepID=UPI0013D85B13|nr:alpha-galactosidase [Dysgonomonas sp. 25]NDV67327.1 alpha-galactosidase [Dysgonomonas sp. 25]